MSCSNCCDMVDVFVTIIACLQIGPDRMQWRNDRVKTSEMKSRKFSTYPFAAAITYVQYLARTEHCVLKGIALKCGRHVPHTSIILLTQLKTLVVY